MTEIPKMPAPESVSDVVRRTIRLDGVRALEEEKARVRTSRMKTVLEPTQQAPDTALGDLEG
jgi:hypothetical protein